MSTHDCLVAFEVCGCTAWVSVLGYDDAGTYKEAGKQAKRGFRIEHMAVDAWKARGLWCADHPEGPPWWKSHGGNGRRPVEYVATPGLGL